MDRDVYVAEFGGLTELAAVDERGQILKRVSVRTEFYTARDLEDLRAWLERVRPSVSPRVALRLV